MCGLAGTLIQGPCSEPALNKIRDVFTQNLLANEERGRDATGIAVLNRHGEHHLLKAPVPASEFIASPEYSFFLKNHITSDTTVVLGHTRLPTKGEPANNNNNHPIVVGNIVGIHNGTITNDDQIFMELRQASHRDVPRIGSVDSESIFRLIDTLHPHANPNVYIREIGRAASRLVGSYATLFFNRLHPQLIFLLKYKTPISVHYSSDLNALFFSSRYLFLRKAFGRSVITEALPNQTGYVFDATRLTTLHKQPLFTVALAPMATDPQSSR